MHIALARALMERGALRRETEIDAYYDAVELGCTTTAKMLGTFSLLRAYNAVDQVAFDVVSVTDGARHRILSVDVLRVDGMDLTRFASIYSLGLTGETVKTGKRRGRKPKPRPETQAAPVMAAA